MEQELMCLLLSNQVTDNQRQLSTDYNAASSTLISNSRYNQEIALLSKIREESVGESNLKDEDKWKILRQ